MVLGIGSGGVQLTLFNNNSSANRFTNQSTNRLATGLRLNSGRDDPAGLIAAAQLESDLVEIDAQIRVTSALERRSAIQQSGRQAATDTLNELRGLYVQAAGGLSTDEETAALQQQIDASLDALDNLEATTGVSVSADLDALRSGGEQSLENGEAAEGAELIEAELSRINLASAATGAYQKYTLEVDRELAEARAVATASSLSQIRDADYAQESSNLITGQILTDASVRTMALHNRIQADQVSALFEGLA